jgi:hypothetical protein
VIFAHGSWFGGHALYVKDNRLHYVYNFVGMVEQKVAATEDLPTGENLILSASFEKAGEDPPGVAAGDYPGERPYRFTGGTIKRVVVDVSGEPYLDLERQAEAMLARE